MADIISYTNDKATRTRHDCMGNYKPSSIDIIHEREGNPLLRVYTKDIRTGRIFRIEFSREETVDIMRIMCRSGAAGMNQLCEMFEPPAEERARWAEVERERRS